MNSLDTRSELGISNKNTKDGDDSGSSSIDYSITVLSIFTKNESQKPKIVTGLDIISGCGFLFGFFTFIDGKETSSSSCFPYVP